MQRRQRSEFNLRICKRCDQNGHYAARCKIEITEEQKAMIAMKKITRKLLLIAEFTLRKKDEIRRRAIDYAVQMIKRRGY
jgi:hypothetical protein